MVKSVLNLAWKELLQLVRDRLLLAFLILVPVLLLTLISESTGRGIQNTRLAVWDQERSAFSQELVTAIDNTTDFQLVARAESYGQLQELMNDGQIAAAVIIPPTFSRDAFRPGVGATVDVIVDASNEIVASDAISSLQGIVNLVALRHAGSTSGQPPPGLQLDVDIEFNPTLNIRWSTLTGTLAMITYILILLVASVTFVRERELGTMEQLVVTPISRLELILGKGLMSALIGELNLLLLFLALRGWFQLPMYGSLALLLGLGLLFVVTEIGVGMIISLITNSQQQAILVVFLLAILEITFSGYMVPTVNMPVVMQVLAAVSPLQHFMAISHSIMLKGSSFSMLLGHVVALGLLMAGTLGGALLLFARESA